MHEHAALIDAVGGVAEVARFFDIENLSVVGNWRNRGIPAPRLKAFAKLAADKGVALPPNFIPEWMGESAA